MMRESPRPSHEALASLVPPLSTPDRLGSQNNGEQVYSGGPLPFPRSCRHTVFEIPQRECTAGLSNDLKMMKDPNLEHLVLVKAGADAICLAQNAVGGFEDIDQTLAVASHRGTASRIAVSFALGRSISRV